MVSPLASPVPVISMVPPLTAVPFCASPVGATDCTTAVAAADWPLLSVPSALVSVAVR